MSDVKCQSCDATIAEPAEGWNEVSGAPDFCSRACAEASLARTRERLTATRAEVTGCADCPMFEVTEEYGRQLCRYPGLGDDERVINDEWCQPEIVGTPDWCPLNTAPLLISRKPKP